MVWISGPEGRLAKSLIVLYQQVNNAFPNRDRSSDGTIGDKAHQNTNSDHNPHNGVVYALDVTHDPAHGLNSYTLAEQFLAAKDERIKYIISNRKIASGTGQDHEAWKWRPYDGKNPHDMHIHINVKEIPIGDKEDQWSLDVVPPTPIPAGHPTLAKGSRGAEVKLLQSVILLDGIFGQATEKAVKEFQKANNLEADGIVGPYTWRALLKEAEQPSIPIGDWIEGITATVFGGNNEDEPSAYDGHLITESELAIALPDRFEGKRPKIQIKTSGETLTASIEDVGPWNINDPYWEVPGQRPDAETHFKNHTPLTLDGPNKGKIPSNPAGIDLSPALAKKLNISGKGLVSWRFLT